MTKFIDAQGAARLPSRVSGISTLGAFAQNLVTDRCPASKYERNATDRLAPDQCCSVPAFAGMETNDDPFEQFLIRCEPEFSTSARRHQRLRAKLAKFFQWRRCEEPEGLADETIGRLVAITYGGTLIEKPSSYVRAVALNVYREHVRLARKLAPLRVDWEVALEEAWADPDASARQECARHCCEKLSDDKRLLLEQYYSDEGSRETLAARAGVSLAALRTRIHRLKVELRECYQECINRSSRGSGRN